MTPHTPDDHKIDYSPEDEELELANLELEAWKGQADKLHREIRAVIGSWIVELEIEKTWPKDLHVADVLEKHVFPAIRDRLEGKSRDRV